MFDLQYSCTYKVNIYCCHFRPGAPVMVAMLLFIASATTIVICYKDVGPCGLFQLSLSIDHQDRSRFVQQQRYTRSRPKGTNGYNRLGSSLNRDRRPLSKHEIIGQKTYNSDSSTVNLQKKPSSSEKLFMSSNSDNSAELRPWQESSSRDRGSSGTVYDIDLYERL